MLKRQSRIEQILREYALIPWIAWQVFVPAALDITAYENMVDYDFRDRNYATEFAGLNDNAIE